MSDSRTRTSFGELDVYASQTGGTALLAYDLDRDVSGRITKKTETVQGVTTVWEYGYHPERGWLVEVKKDGVVVESYSYDANGNRESWSDFWGSGTATHDAQDRLLTAGETSYTYTSNGELLTKSAGSETTSYVYDVQGALTRMTLPTGVEIEYVTDAEGRRIGKKVNGVLVQGWIYAGGLSPIAETDGAGTITKRYVYGTRVNVPEYLVRGGGTYRIVTDHLGSVRMVVDSADGTVVQRIDYDAFGRITLDTNPGWQPFGFAGGLYEPQARLVRFGARDYDPEMGRWTLKDPIGFAGGSPGLYSYVDNDPLNYIDPSGLLTIIVHGTSLAAFAVGSSSNGEWADAGDDFNSVVSSTFGENAMRFEWSGENNWVARSIGALDLKEFIDENLRPGEELNIVAHSHGGNVVKEYTRLSGAKRIDTFVALGTPQRNDYLIKRRGVGHYINVFSRNDGVQRIGSGSLSLADRTDFNALNVEISWLPATNRISSPVGHSRLHTAQVWNRLVEILGW